MTWKEKFLELKKGIIGDDLVLRSIADADALHGRCLDLRRKLYELGMMDMMPHYRGEQRKGWDIRPGIFRPPNDKLDADAGKKLEQSAITEFESVIKNKVGDKVLRDIFNKQKYGREWDLLIQAQHAGIRTTLTDLTAEILSALYFATEASADSAIESADGQLWCLLLSTNIIIGQSRHPDARNIYDLDPFSLKETWLINPSSYLDDISSRIFEYRMFRQKGRFIMLAAQVCNIPLNQQKDWEDFLLRVTVPADSKKAIREEMTKREIIRSYLYADENPDRQQLIDEINYKIFD